MKSYNKNSRIILSASVAALVGLTACQQQPQVTESAESNARGATPTAATAKPAPKASFAGMDGNSDGSIAATEHADSAAAMFAAMDGDNNSSVTTAEMDASISAVGGSTVMSSADKIKAIDQNSDGMLSVTEHMDGSKSMFGKMDTDQSGALNEAEYDAGHKALK